MAEAYLDACCLIYLTEGTPAWRSAIEARLLALPQATGLVTSRLSRLECRSKPLRTLDTALLARYDGAFSRTRLVAVTDAIIERATDVRARYGFRSPDALHIATAIEQQAHVFITGDAALARCTDVTVEVVVPVP